MARSILLVGLVAVCAVSAEAQSIPELSARCNADNARIGGMVIAQCMPLETVTGKLACGKRIRTEQHEDPECFAATRRRLAALNHACLARTAPETYERSGICTSFREHPTAFAK